MIAMIVGGRTAGKEQDGPKEPRSGNSLVQEQREGQRQEHPQRHAQQEDHLVSEHLAEGRVGKERAKVVEPDERTVVAGIPSGESVPPRDGRRYERESA